jgi:hypothetical protein
MDNLTIREYYDYFNVAKPCLRPRPRCTTSRVGAGVVATVPIAVMLMTDSKIPTRLSIPT